MANNFRTNGIYKGDKLNDGTDIIIARAIRLGNRGNWNVITFCDRRRTFVEKPRHRGKKTPTWAWEQARHHHRIPLEAKQLEHSVYYIWGMIQSHMPSVVSRSSMH